VIIINESAKKFQTLGLENPSLFNNMELIWVQHWSLKQLVDNALYHFNGINNEESPSKIKNYNFHLSFVLFLKRYKMAGFIVQREFGSLASEHAQFNTRK
jgi:hypothetical protein